MGPPPALLVPCTEPRSTPARFSLYRRTLQFVCSMYSIYCLERRARENLTQKAGSWPTQCALCLGADLSNNCRCLFFSFSVFVLPHCRISPRRCKCRCHHHQTSCVTGLACVGFARKAKHCPPVVSALRPCHTTADQSRSRQQPKCNATCDMHASLTHLPSLTL